MNGLQFPQVCASLARCINLAFAVRSGIPANRAMPGLWRDAVSDAWPLPPVALRPMHDARRMHQTWERLLQLLRKPVQEVPWRAGWCMRQVLGSAVFLTSASRQIHAFMWRGDSAEVMLSHLASYSVMMTEVPYRWVWLKQLCEQAKTHALATLRLQGDQAHDDICAAHTEWMFGVFRSRIRHHGDMRQVRERIRAGLGLDAHARRICHHLQMPCLLPDKSSFSHYHLTIRHLDALRCMEQEAPQALGVYAELCEQSDFPPTGQPTQRLKAFLSANGLPPRIWALVLQDGSRVMRLVRQFYRGAASASVLDCLRIFRDLHTPRAPAPWLSQAIYSEFGNAGARRQQYHPALKTSMPDLAHLVRRVSALPKPGDEQEQELVAVISWLTEPDRSCLDRRQRQAGWDYLVAHGLAHIDARVKASSAQPVAWKTPFSEVLFAGWRMKAMANSQELVEEGLRMRNCIGERIAECASSSKLLVSVSNALGKRVATAEYRRSKTQWVCLDAKGPMNRVLDISVRRKLGEFARQIEDVEADEPARGTPQAQMVITADATKMDYG